MVRFSYRLSLNSFLACLSIRPRRVWCFQVKSCLSGLHISCNITIAAYGKYSHSQCQKKREHEVILILVCKEVVVQHSMESQLAIGFGADEYPPPLVELSLNYLEKIHVEVKPMVHYPASIWRPPRNFQRNPPKACWENCDWVTCVMLFWAKKCQMFKISSNVGLVVKSKQLIPKDLKLTVLKVIVSDFGKIAILAKNRNFTFSKTNAHKI